MNKLEISSLLYKELFSWAKTLFVFALEQFSNDYEKSIPKKLLRQITTEANNAMNQSEFLTITCNLLKAREKWRVQSAIGLIEKLARDF